MTPFVVQKCATNGAISVVSTARVCKTSPILPRSAAESLAAANIGTTCHNPTFLQRLRTSLGVHLVGRVSTLFTQGTNGCVYFVRILLCVYFVLFTASEPQTRRKQGTSKAQTRRKQAASKAQTLYKMTLQIKFQSKDFNSACKTVLVSDHGSPCNTFSPPVAASTLANVTYALPREDCSFPVLLVGMKVRMGRNRLAFKMVDMVHRASFSSSVSNPVTLRVLRSGCT